MEMASPSPQQAGGRADGPTAAEPLEEELSGGEEEEIDEEEGGDSGEGASAGGAQVQGILPVSDEERARLVRSLFFQVIGGLGAAKNIAPGRRQACTGYGAGQRTPGLLSRGPAGEIRRPPTSRRRRSIKRSRARRRVLSSTPTYHICHFSSIRFFFYSQEFVHAEVEAFLLKFFEGDYAEWDKQAESKKRLLVGDFKGFRTHSVCKAWLFALQHALEVSPTLSL